MAENTEKLIVKLNLKNGSYFCPGQGFVGSLAEAKQFAQDHGFGGGVEIVSSVRGKLTFTKV